MIDQLPADMVWEIARKFTFYDDYLALALTCKRAYKILMIPTRFDLFPYYWGYDSSSNATCIFFTHGNYTVSIHTMRISDNIGDKRHYLGLPAKFALKCFTKIGYRDEFIIRCWQKDDTYFTIKAERWPSYYAVSLCYFRRNGLPLMLFTPLGRLHDVPNGYRYDLFEKSNKFIIPQKDIDGIYKVISIIDGIWKGNIAQSATSILKVHLTISEKAQNRA